jgi:hypothetical protein
MAHFTWAIQGHSRECAGLRLVALDGPGKPGHDIWWCGSGYASYFGVSFSSLLPGGVSSVIEPPPESVST